MDTVDHGGGDWCGGVGEIWYCIVAAVFKDKAV